MNRFLQIVFFISFFVQTNGELFLYDIMIITTGIYKAYSILHILKILALNL